jgi:phospholipid-translocating ATPase
VEDYANKGLRTLVLAYRTLDPEWFENWQFKLKKAQLALSGKDRLLEVVASELETDLTLLGSTGIEDRLQPHVAQTIGFIREAGIKLWVLTGDKVETAINIGYSCELLDK